MSCAKRDSNGFLARDPPKSEALQDRPSSDLRAPDATRCVFENAFSLRHLIPCPVLYLTIT
jgi:hypothetical protein